MVKRLLTLPLAISIALLLTTALIADEPAAAAKKVDQPESLKTAIKDGIDLATAGKSNEFLERFVLPADKAKMKKSGQWDEVTKQFPTEKMPNILAVLKKAQSMQVELNDDGSKASFNLPTETKFPPGGKISFEKVDNVWYIAN